MSRCRASYRLPASPAPSATRTKRLHLRPRDLQVFNKRVREIFAERFKPDHPVTFSDFEAIVHEVGSSEIDRQRSLDLYHTAVDTSCDRGGAEDSISAAVFAEVLMPVALSLKQTDSPRPARHPTNQLQYLESLIQNTCDAAVSVCWPRQGHPFAHTR